LSNPTTPFGWQMPTATDLVTDLPADFEVFGQAVATSMGDLLGGTSGQVLAKNSNTDMDFVWVTSDDANAIQNTIVDAKGDLIAASAADTPARLAVGANDTMLVGDSTAATGLSYKSASTLYAYTTWTPTFANFTKGNGTVIGRYAQIGKLVHCQLRVALGSTSSVTGLIQFSLPATANQDIQGSYIGLNNAVVLDSGVAQYICTCALISSTDAVIFASAAGGTYVSTQSTSATVPITWATNDEFRVNFVYEAV